MNFAWLRHPPQEGKPRPVVYQNDLKNPMEPRNLLVAYEESQCNRALPVVSDFDCFLVGTRAVKYEETIPEDQVKMV